MNIQGLENNYYLAGNNIWVLVDNFDKNPIRLDLKVTNFNTSKTMPLLRLYPEPSNIFRFNISQTVRPLQPYPDHTDLNSIQSYRFEFVVTFEDNTTDAITLDKYFIRGGRDKNNIDEWYLYDGAKLIIDKWVEWRGVVLPGFANKIMNSLIVDYIPASSETFKMLLPDTCNIKIVKFLNSLGGYQFWVFESFEVRSKVNSKAIISQIPLQLRNDVSRNTGTETSTEITFKTKTPKDLQGIIIDLIQSPEILMYDPGGVDASSSWLRLQLSSNDALYNSTDMSYGNEISCILPNYVNRDL